MGKVVIEVPHPVLPTIKLEVVKDLQIGDVFYTAGHIIEVFHPEAVALMRDYGDYFEVLTS